MRTLTITLILSAFLGMQPLATAQWSWKPDDALMVYDGPVDYCNWSSQIQLGDGSFLVSYSLESYGSVPEWAGYVQKISLVGQKLWGEEGIRFCPDNDSSYGMGKLVPDGQGGAILLWKDARGTTPTWELYGQHLSSTGEFLWDTNGVLLVTPGNDYDYFQFDICEDGEGGAYITWPEEEEYSSHGDIYAQRIDGDSNPIWSQPVPVCTAANSDQHGPKITLNYLERRRRHHCLAGLSFRHFSKCRRSASGSIRQHSLAAGWSELRYYLRKLPHHHVRRAGWIIVPQL